MKLENKVVYLMPGEIFFGEAPLRIKTLLGSCVAVTLWHPGMRIGGMSHIVLPKSSNGRCDPRYGDCVINEFIERISTYNTKPSDYHVGVFGGGNMFPGIKQDGFGAIGEKNFSYTAKLLKDEGFKVKISDVGEHAYRNIELDLEDGSINIRKTDIHERINKLDHG